jgi:hypothetical protein
MKVFVEHFDTHSMVPKLGVYPWHGQKKKDVSYFQ